jgi:hypothetical protein
MDKFESDFNISQISEPILNDDFSLKEYKKVFTTNNEVVNFNKLEIKFEVSGFRSEVIQEGFMSNERLDFNYGDNIISRRRRINRKILDK